MHVCWGAGETPHNHDVPLRETSSIYCSRGGRWPCLLWGQMGAMSMSGKYGRTCGSRLGRCSSPGSSTRRRTSSSIPRWWRNALYATPPCWGAENVIAGVDCGFGTSAQTDQVDSEVAWAKLRALVEGAELATRALWST